MEEDDSIVQLYVRAFPRSTQPIKCIIIHRILLYLHLKNIKFKMIGVDEINKTQILGAEFSSCSLPLFKHEEFYSDDLIDVFVYLGTKYKENKIERSIKQENISKALYPAFMSYVKNKDKSKDSIILSKLNKELEIVTNFLDKNGGPYMDGEQISTIDTILFPKLYQIYTYFKKMNQKCPITNFSQLEIYFNNLKDREDLKQFHPDDRSLEFAFSKN